VAIKPTKTDAKGLREILDPDWKELDASQLAVLDEIAMACCEAAFQLYEDKAKYAVVGQLLYGPYEAIMQPDEDKVSLGFYSTVIQAQNAAEGLTRATGGATEVFRSWVLPVWHGTPAAWHSQRVAAIKESIEAVTITPAKRLSASIQARADAEAASIPRCDYEALDYSMEWQPCIREAGHRGHCLARSPETWGERPK
jgi:hypothetical protein